MKSELNKIALALLLVCFAPMSASANVFDNGTWNLAGGTGTFNYTLSYDDLLVIAGNPAQPAPAERSGKFYDDAINITNFVVRNEGSGHYLNSELGQANASFTFRFDFESKGYEATSVTIADYLVMFNTATSGATIKVEYRINDDSWQLLSSLTNAGTTQELNHKATPWGVIDGVVISSFDYRVTSTGNVVYNYADQWGRANNATTNPFSITFDVVAVPVPEPASVVFLSGAGIFGIVLLRRKLRR
ncbi:MAG: PEP-CTERM sorting domain-containing protein [Opitutaceae bacterium]|jgi:hypothetical protein|nr:PEP-CTERM sorting domain-containing protein [Opitutaceae bacterium]